MSTVDPALLALRTRLAASEAKAKPRNGGSAPSDPAVIQHFRIPEGNAATIRLLPDGDPENSFPWVERQTIKLPFAGISGGSYPTDQQVFVTVQCNDMFAPKTCPIIRATNAWWRDPARVPLARLYYKKRSYLYNCLAVVVPFTEDDPPAMRRAIFGPALHQRVVSGLADPDMEYLPTHVEHGCDFRIRKTKKQDYNNYDTSDFARKPRALSEAERAILAANPLPVLSTFLGPRPDADGLATIQQLFDDSLAGAPFDYDAFGGAYRPYGAGYGAAEDAGAEANGHSTSAGPVADNGAILADLRKRTANHAVR